MAELIYQAGFEKGERDPLNPLPRPALVPVVDEIQGGPLHWIQAPDLSVQPEKDFLESPAGIRFKLQRTNGSPTPDLGGATKDDCIVGAVVNPFPNDITNFKVRATFELPHFELDPPDQLYGWAMAVFARTGDVTYWPTRDERITVTLRSSNRSGKPSGFLNNPGGAPRFTGAIPAALYEGIFKSEDPNRSTFTLELLIDRTDKVARAGLDALIYNRPGPSPSNPSTPYSERRWFTHLLVTNFDADVVPGDREALPIDSVGFAIAIASGKATACATIRDFRIYRLSIIDIWLLRLEAWLANWLPASFAARLR